MTNLILGALVSGAIVSTLLTIAVWAGLLLTPRRVLSAADRYIVWWTALIAVAGLPLAYLPTRPTIEQRVSTSSPATPVVVIPTPAVPVVAAPIMTPIVRARFPVTIAAGPWTRWILLLWACLSASLLLRLVTSCFLLARRKSGSSPAPAPLTERIERALGRRKAAVLRSATMAAPVLAGLWRPAILIPHHLFDEMTGDELAQIGLHEAAHLARCDDFALVLQRALEAVLPFHPAIRWIARQIELERELACDDLVVATTGAARDYAASLLHTLELCGASATPWSGAGVIGMRSQLSTRVDRLLDPQRAVRRTTVSRVLAPLALVVALAFVAARTPRTIVFAMPQAPVEQPAIQPLPTAPQQFPEPPITVAPVVVPVTVEDLAHRYVGGLKKESFRILEDGIEQPITELTTEHHPLSVVVIVDSSGSMRGKRALVETAVRAMIQAADPADEFVVLTTNSNGSATALSRDPAQSLGELHGLQLRGGTTIRDAALQARDFTTTYPERMTVLLSDGGPDNASRASADDFRAAIAASGSPFWAITLAPAPSWVASFAELSEGHEFAVEDSTQVAGVAASLMNRTFYVLKYTPTGRRPGGAKARIQVNVVDAPPGTLKLRYRMYAY